MRSLILTGAEQHSINAVQYTRAFFLDSETAINPNAAYAQVIRGPPGSQEGGYEGVLDFNSLVKVVNAVQVLRFSGRPEWSGDIEAGILDWAGKYLVSKVRRRRAPQSEPYIPLSGIGRSKP